jgi:hypothetical protein
MAPFYHLVAAVRAPFDKNPAWADLSIAPSSNEEVRQTFCGT